jgi:hypothetical protein
MAAFSAGKPNASHPIGCITYKNKAIYYKQGPLDLYGYILEIVNMYN